MKIIKTLLSYLCLFTCFVSIYLVVFCFRVFYWWTKRSVSSWGSESVPRKYRGGSVMEETETVSFYERSKIEDTIRTGTKRNHNMDPHVGICHVNSKRTKVLQSIKFSMSSSIKHRLNEARKISRVDKIPKIYEI